LLVLVELIQVEAAAVVMLLLHIVHTAVVQVVLAL
jgi:hypothetical protein